LLFSAIFCLLYHKPIGIGLIVWGTVSFVVTIFYYPLRYGSERTDGDSRFFVGGNTQKPEIGWELQAKREKEILAERKRQRKKEDLARLAETTRRVSVSKSWEKSPKTTAVDLEVPDAPPTPSAPAVPARSRGRLCCAAVALPWTVGQVRRALEEEGFSREICEAFERECIDGEALFELTETSLSMVLPSDVPVGHRLKLEKWLRQLSSRREGEEEPGYTTARVPSLDGERIF
jgi:hypothetical protein